MTTRKMQVGLTSLILLQKYDISLTDQAKAAKTKGIHPKQVKAVTEPLSKFGKACCLH